MDAYIQELFEELRKDATLDKEGIAKLKVKLCKKYNQKTIPTDIQIFLSADNDMVDLFRKRLQTKPNRSLSGVAPIAIMTSPARCPHGKCTMCPGGIDSPWGDMPQSYTGAEPATMRGKRANFDPYLQVCNRLEQYMVTGHIADKVDLILMGGTFTARDTSYQDTFVSYAFKAMNDFSELFFKDGIFQLDTFKEFFELPGQIGDSSRTERIHKKLLDIKGTTISLEDEQKRNETASIRCIGLTIETKPDWAFLEHANRMLAHGCTRVELGVQSVYDDALTAIHRGHSVADNKKSIAILRDLGFKLNFHMMIGLPTVDYQHDVEGLIEIFKNDAYKPDMIKIYPCMVMPGTALMVQYRNGEFKPVETEIAAKIIADIIPHVPTYCRIMRVQRDIPTYRTEAGVNRTNLRQYVDTELEKRGIQSRDIRARESGRKKAKKTPVYELISNEYTASDGTEFFISIEDTANDILAGFCRLRFPSKARREEFTNTTAIVRELHVYGSAISIGEQDQESTQHKGFGKKLLAKAEQIVQNRGYNKLLIISGVGVREYYKKRGYHLEGPYMAKIFDEPATTIVD